MDFETQNAAMNTALRFKLVAEIAEAWAAGEFEETTRADATRRGWDAESEAPKVWSGPGGAEAIATPDETEIQFCDEFGDAWAFNPTTGELRRG